MQVGRVYDAACQLLMAEQPEIGAGDVTIPIVAECDDSFLSEPRRMQVEPPDVAAALLAARASVGSGFPQEGAVGAGTGMSCLGYKGGIGTASRAVPDGHTVGVLVPTNFGERARLAVAGLPAGRLLPDPAAGPPGSWLRRVVHRRRDHRRAAGRGRLHPAGPPGRAGPGPAGSTATHGSGEIFLALATGLRAPRGRRRRERRSSAARSTATSPPSPEATEEAVLNSLLQAVTVTGRDGNPVGCPPARSRHCGRTRRRAMMAPARARHRRLPRAPAAPRPVRLDARP